MDRIVSSHRSAIDLVAALAEQYQLSAIRPLLDICVASANHSHLSVAVLGRFKAGKSSFLNHLIGRDILPVGVLPVTSVVTELGYGPVDLAEVRFSDGREIQVAPADLLLYVTEKENPNNGKRVIGVSVRIPELSRWKDIRFIDTPGLESTFAHNTETSLAWAPNVDIALVAVGVDTPLSQQDVGLIGNLLKYTPRIAVLLTKVDALSGAEQRQVAQFVRTQLARNFAHPIPVYPYSTRSSYEELRIEMERSLLTKVAGDVTSQRHSILSRKVATLVRECQDCIRLGSVLI